jgi:hypothetical protein
MLPTTVQLRARLKQNRDCNAQCSGSNFFVVLKQNFFNVLKLFLVISNYNFKGQSACQDARGNWFKNHC